MEILDFEHRVLKIIDECKDNPDFPQMEERGITQFMLDDYLFDKQAILDSEGSERSQYTRLGFFLILPILVLAAFPTNSLPWHNDLYSVLVGLGIGLTLAALQKLLFRLVIAKRLRKLAHSNPDVDKYITDLLNYSKK